MRSNQSQLIEPAHESDRICTCLCVSRNTGSSFSSSISSESERGFQTKMFCREAFEFFVCASISCCRTALYVFSVSIKMHCDCRVGVLNRCTLAHRVMRNWVFPVAPLPDISVMVPHLNPPSKIESIVLFPVEISRHVLRIWLLREEAVYIDFANSSLSEKYVWISVCSSTDRNGWNSKVLYKISSSSIVVTPAVESVSTHSE